MKWFIIFLLLLYPSWAIASYISATSAASAGEEIDACATRNPPIK